MDDLELEQRLQALIKDKTVLCTPDAKRGAPFSLTAMDEEALLVGTQSGGQVRIDRFLGPLILKFLSDRRPENEGWVQINDPDLKLLSFAENRKTGCLSYLLPALEACGAVELDRARPARVRIKTLSQ